MRKRFTLIFLFIMLVVPMLTASVMAQELAKLSDLPAGEWTKIEPGGDTVCLYGDPYGFFVRPAETPSNKLMVFFQGGGACWDGLTCGAVGQFASQYDVGASITEETSGQGIFDLANTANPIKDYNIVFAPVCSGDIFTGDAEKTYDVPKEALGVDYDTIDVQFKGFVNAQAVLNWTYTNFEEPEQVFVAGCSAGGYGAIFHTPYIMQHYEGVPVVQFSDASNGVIARGWTGLSEWGIDANLPRFLPNMTDITVDKFRINMLYTGTAKLFPDNRFSQYNSFLDEVQIFFYGFQRGVNLLDPANAEQGQAIGADWASAMVSNNVGLDRAIPNYDFYMAGGGLHCITESPAFFNYEVDGVMFTDWVAGLLDNTADDVRCDRFSTVDCLVAPWEPEE